MKVIVVAPSELLRSAIELGIRLAPETGLEVAATAATGEAGLELAREHGAALVVLDLDLPGRAGPPCLERLAALDPPPKVLVLTDHADGDRGMCALDTGAVAVLKKRGLRAEGLRDALRAAL